ncbi:MAG: methyltransferase domain-containing protein [Oscillochloris sp.]|nr:methyltransferase domain-containing protein [Oscillochloris sp.]
MAMSYEPDQGRIAGRQWNPNQYLKFADQRLRPALELLERVDLATPELIYDLGCGTGQITRVIAQRWPAATVYGLDNSPEMLAKAAAEPSDIQWLEADVSDWQPAAAPDLIYSNATLHWVVGHRELFPRLLQMLKPGGVLAVQMPLSWDAPSHRLMRETLAHGGANGAPLGTPELRQAMDRRWVEDAEQYYDWLVDGSAALDIWASEYLQVLAGPDPVLEWVKGTGLRPVLNGLDAAERAQFLHGYAARLRETYPMRADGSTLYPFRRLFLVAQRQA